MPRSVPQTPRRRPIPRMRKVVIRLDPAHYDRLERISRSTGVELEALARQMVVDNLNRRPA